MSRDAPTSRRAPSTCTPRRRSGSWTGAPAARRGPIARVERWRPRSEAPEPVLNELVALHDREYRVESVLLETLVDGALPRATRAPMRDLDDVRLALITRTMNDLARRGALRVRAGDAIALAHALLSYPTWRTALTGPARRRAPRLVAAALRSAVLMRACARCVIYRLRKDRT